MKQLILIFFIHFIPYLTFSQADCVLKFKYKGEIKTTKYKVYKIKLPSTRYISGYTNFEKESRNFEIDSLKFSFISSSHMSSEFCVGVESIVKNTFMKIQFYPIEIYFKNMSEKLLTRKFKIPIEKMKFVITKENKLEIIYPLIEL